MMLSRVASHLYWLSRYLERAENMARIIDVGHSLALLSGASDDSTAMELLVITDSLDAFRATGRSVNAENVARFLAWDPSLPSSIVNCLESSRENTRAVRGSVTSEMWETINDTWLQLQARRRSGREPIDSEFFDWVKERSHLFRGVGYGTMPRDAAYRFVRVGTFLERADSTARLLDVKYHVLLPSTRDVGGAVDYYQWGALLRSVSAFQAYRRIYRDVIKPERVAELLILRDDMPRSLRVSFGELTRLLDELRERGVGLAFVTLHVGLDTFKPISEDEVESHVIHTEWCHLPQATADAITSARARGGRVVAVGTTSARVLESARLFIPSHEPLREYSGFTNLFITPGFDYRLVDHLITNFHLPRSTLLSLVGALMGMDFMRRAYTEAVAQEYRFYSFGDAMLVR